MKKECYMNHHIQRGAPQRNSKRLSLRLEADLLEHTTQQASLDERTLSNWIHRLIHLHKESHKALGLPTNKPLMNFICVPINCPAFVARLAMDRICTRN